jgi:hypothetical protein
MRYTSEQLQALLDLRASGRLSVKLGDVETRFQTGADLDKAIAAARRDVEVSENGRPARRYLVHGRGY